MHTLISRLLFALLLFGTSAISFATPTLSWPDKKPIDAVKNQSVHFKAYRLSEVSEYAEGLSVPVVLSGSHYVVATHSNTAVFDTVPAQTKDFSVVPVVLAEHAQPDVAGAGFLILLASSHIGSSDPGDRPFSTDPLSTVIGQVALDVVMKYLGKNSAAKLENAFVSVVIVRGHIAKQ